MFREFVNFPCNIIIIVGSNQELFDKMFTCAGLRNRKSIKSYSVDEKYLLRVYGWMVGK